MATLRTPFEFLRAARREARLCNARIAVGRCQQEADDRCYYHDKVAAGLCQPIEQRRRSPKAA